MPMYCQTCGTDMMGGCDCEYWDFSTPIVSIRVRATGDTTDPWVLRDFSQYTAEVTFGDTTVQIPLCFREASEEKFDGPRPSRTFLKSLRRTGWEVTEETPDETIYEIPHPFYTAKFVRVPKKNQFRLIARAVDLNPENSHKDCYTGGKATLTFSMEYGENFLKVYSDHLTDSSAGWTNSPWDLRADDDHQPADWMYVDKSRENHIHSIPMSERPELA